MQTQTNTLKYEWILETENKFFWVTSLNNTSNSLTCIRCCNHHTNLFSFSSDRIRGIQLHVVQTAFSALSPTGSDAFATYNWQVARLVVYLQTSCHANGHEVYTPRHIATACSILTANKYYGIKCPKSKRVIMLHKCWQYSYFQFNLSF